jgi:ribonuclease HI
MPKQKYYVVWKGRRTGILTSWPDCSAAVTGYPEAEYKAFDSLAEAQEAFRTTYQDFRSRLTSTQRWLFAPTRPILPSICVDAACDGSPGRLEYRGVDTESRRQIFHAGPYADGTNNVGEFLAIVHALRWLAGHNRGLPLYSDSTNAIAWVRAGKCRTKLARTGRNAELFELIASAEDWLAGHLTPSDPREMTSLLKWDTATWGENPADFGRK